MAPVRKSAHPGLPSCITPDEMELATAAAEIAAAREQAPSMSVTDLHAGIKLLQCLADIRVARALQVFMAVAAAIDRQADLIVALDVASRVTDAIARTGRGDLLGAERDIGIVGGGWLRGRGRNIRRGLRDGDAAHAEGGSKHGGKDQLFHGWLRSRSSPSPDGDCPTWLQGRRGSRLSYDSFRS